MYTWQGSHELGPVISFNASDLLASAQFPSEHPALPLPGSAQRQIVKAHLSATPFYPRKSSPI